MNLQIQLIQNLKYENVLIKKKKSTKLYFRILIYKNYTLDELKFVNVCIKRRLCLYSAGNF